MDNFWATLIDLVVSVGIFALLRWAKNLRD